MAQLSRLTVIKFLEMVLVCILIGLHYHSFIARNEHTVMLTTGTFVGYVIIIVGLFIGGLMGTPVNRRVDLIFSVVGCILFIVCGALAIHQFQSLAFKSSFRDIGIAKGCISIIEGVLFLIDAFLTYRGES